MKAIMRVGYTDYVMDIAAAQQIAETLLSAERYHSKGWGDEERHFVWHEPGASKVNITVIDDALYGMAKLAGKPEKD